jgi:AraC family transcriptional regulator
MTVSVESLSAMREPVSVIQHGQVLDMVLWHGSIEVGLQQSKMTSYRYLTGEMILCGRHVKEWVRSKGMDILSVNISDAALSGASDGSSRGVELQSTGHLKDARIGALLAAVNAERIAGFPSGRIFLDCVEQAIGAALVSHHAIRSGSVRVHRGGLTRAQIRRVTELVDAKIAADLSLHEMAKSTGLSIAHFSRMFRKSTGQSPHQFVLRHRVERAREMLHAVDMRVLDVAVACGFRTQQHFARIFRRVYGASPTEYRSQFLR